jgi:hypothetical protein
MKVPDQSNVILKNGQIYQWNSLPDLNETACSS